MGFLDFLGSAMGSMAAKMQEAQSYMSEYEPMTDKELIREYNDLKGRSGREVEARKMAVRTILNQRGYGNNN